MRSCKGVQLARLINDLPMERLEDFENWIKKELETKLRKESELVGKDSVAVLEEFEAPK